MEEKEVSKKVKKGHGEGSIAQRDDDTWWARIMIGYQPNGQPKRKAFYGKTEAEVKRKLREFKKNIDNLPKDTIAKMSLSVYMNNWLETYKMPTLKPTSYDRLEDQKRLYIDPTLEYVQMKNLNTDDIQKLLNNLSKKYSHSTVKKVYMLLNACLNHAVAKKDLTYNPMAPIEVPKQKEFSKKEIVILTEAEEERFITEATKKYSNGVDIYRIGWAYVLMLFTGLRIGELLALKFTDFDEDEKMIKVSSNIVLVKNRNRKEGEPKNKYIEQTAKTDAAQYRIVPLSRGAMEAVLALKEINSNFTYICSSRNNKPVPKRAFDRAYRQICIKAGIDPVGVHSLRHTFASKLFRKGADVKTVSELLGHANTKITYNTYIHIMPEQKKSAIALLD